MSGCVRFVRPGQVAPDRPVPDRCVACGQPEAAHPVTDVPRCCYWCGHESATGMRPCMGFEGKWECADAEACRRRSAGDGSYEGPLLTGPAVTA